MISFDEFIEREGFPTNSYVTEEGFSSLYVRRGGYIISGKVYQKVIQLANFEVKEKGKGTFTRFIERIQERYEIPIVVENVLNERLGPKLLLMGFELIDEESNTYIINT